MDVNKNTPLKQGQRVKVYLNEEEVFGKIVGIAINGLPLIGLTYIIEPEKPLNFSGYSYSHFVANELQIELVY